MALFDTIKEPIILKESSTSAQQLEILKDLYQKSSGELQLVQSLYWQILKHA